MASSDNNLIWIDLEMSGLEPQTHAILEVATIVTDAQLTILAEGEALAIHQSPQVLTAMDDWCTATHTASGLVARVQQSSLNEQAAEQQVLGFVQRWVSPGVSPICGNSIAQDRRFLRRYMPQLEAYFHYRCIDVSTLKELAKRWRPQILDGLQKQCTHQALADIRESIAELRYYRRYFIDGTVAS